MKYKIIPVTAYQQNCSLIWCEKTSKAALIDPGGDIEVLLAQVDELGLQLKKILLTHGHLDHVGGAKQIATKLEVPIIGPHQADAFWLQSLPKQSEMFGFAYTDAFEPDQWLAEGAEIKVGDMHLSVLHCPGHTPGHVVFYSETDGLLFVGDVLFQGSIGRTDFPQGDYDALIASIKQKLLPLGDEVMFVPGHGPMSSLGHERQNNPFLQN